jgi:DNA-binding GntR family transcriptional regulator
LPKQEASRVEVATNVIRDRILDLTFEPGKPISDKVLLEKYGLGRTPSREALARLAAEGLVDFFPQMGAFARALDFTEISQLFEAYRVSDRLIGHYCDFDDGSLVNDVQDCQRRQREAIRDRRFNDITYWFSRHRLRMAETCRNRYIYEFCERTHNQVRRLVCLQYQVEMHQPGFPEWQIELLTSLHADVIEALKGRDRRRLLAVLSDQIRVFEQRISTALTSPRERSQELELGHTVLQDPNCGQSQPVDLGTTKPRP